MELVISLAVGFGLGLAVAVLIFLMGETKYKVIYNLYMLTHQHYLTTLQSNLELKAILENGEGLLPNDDGEDEDDEPNN